MTAIATPVKSRPVPVVEKKSILVVDDAAMDRRLAGRLLEKHPSFAVSYAENGQQALDMVLESPPAAVVTDIQMPGIGGLQLVEEVRARFPHVPVVLMTGQGSEDVAIQALQRGASSYVPKRDLARELVRTLTQVLNAARIDRFHQRVFESLTSVEFNYTLDNDPEMVGQLVSFLQEYLTRMGIGDETGRIRMGVALNEAMLNGIYHGNLELPHDLDSRGSNVIEEMIAERRSTAPYGDRRLHVQARFATDKAVFVVRDEGPGFDPQTLPDPNDPTTIDRPGWKGILLIRSFMDHVSHNATGNEITLVKMGQSTR